MDNTQKNLIWLSISLIICIVLIKYAIYLVDKNNKQVGDIKVEAGTGTQIEEEKNNSNNKNNEENKEEILEEIKVTSELVINHLNRKELYNKSSKVLYGKIIDKKDAVYSKDIKYPFTTATFEISEIIKGELSEFEGDLINSNEKTKIDIKVPGGKVKLSEYMRAIIEKNPEEIAKKGYDKLNEKEKEGKYIKIDYEYTNSFEKNEWYIIFVMEDENNKYIVPTYTCMLPANEFMKNITKEGIMEMPEVTKK